MKAAKGKAMSATAAYQSVAESTGLKAKDVKGTVEALISVAADELKKNGSFKIAGALNLKLKKKPATPCAQGCQPIHERTLRLQSQAGIQDREGTPDEKAQRVDQLMMQTFCGHCTEDS